MSKLVELYVKEIKLQNITIEDVPIKLRTEVESELNKVVIGGE